MGLLDNAISAGSHTLDGGAWVDSLASKARNQVVPQLPTSLQDPANQSIDRLAASKGALGTIAGRTFTAIVAYFGLGLEDEARLLFLRDHASHAERQAALRAAIGQASSGDTAAHQAWVEVRAAALDILKNMGQAAIPLLLASL